MIVSMTKDMHLRLLNASISSRSPYVFNTTVLTKGQVTILVIPEDMIV